MYHINHVERVFMINLMLSSLIKTVFYFENKDISKRPQTFER